MSGRSGRAPTYDPNLVEVKSKFECEFRRFSVDRTQMSNFNDFSALVKESHWLPQEMPFSISYTDPRNGDLLPINNDDNLNRAFTTAMPLMRLIIYRKQDLMLEDMSRSKKKKSGRPPSTLISPPQDFRRVCAIVDADLLPDTIRRVKLLKHSTDRPLGFYIRDGTSVRVTPYGLEKVPGIFISRLVPGGLAEGTGLLAVNDEILEVNGIEVLGKSLDQVTDMMVANSQNLIITVKPANLPPETPATMPKGTKRLPGKQGGGAPQGVVTQAAKSTPQGVKAHDLPSVSATPPQMAKVQEAGQVHKRAMSDSHMSPRPKTESFADTSNGPASAEKKNNVPQRHSLSGLVDS